MANESALPAAELIVRWSVADFEMQMVEAAGALAAVADQIALGDDIADRHCPTAQMHVVTVIAADPVAIGKSGAEMADLYHRIGITRVHAGQLDLAVGNCEYRRADA